MYILGISAFYHDSAACLFRNNTLLGAAEEERFTGIKGDPSFPSKTIRWLFRTNGISINDISVICWYENPDLKKERIVENFKKYLLNTLLSTVYVCAIRPSNSPCVNTPNSQP